MRGGIVSMWTDAASGEYSPPVGMTRENAVGLGETRSTGLLQGGDAAIGSRRGGNPVARPAGSVRSP